MLPRQTASKGLYLTSTKRGTSSFRGFPVCSVALHGENCLILFNKNCFEGRGKRLKGSARMRAFQCSNWSTISQLAILKRGCIAKIRQLPNKCLQRGKSDASFSWVTSIRVSPLSQKQENRAGSGDWKLLNHLRWGNGNKRRLPLLLSDFKRNSNQQKERNNRVST